MPTLPSAGPTRDEEERELAGLLERPEISRSANLVRLLTFVCARYFEGRSQEIRESAIAVEALGRRREGFDSQSDPIVRVTARTLRKRLEEFYRTEGRAPVQPSATGQYVPRFLLADGHPAAPPDGAATEASRSRPARRARALDPGGGGLLARAWLRLRLSLAGTTPARTSRGRLRSRCGAVRLETSSVVRGPDPDR